MHDGAFLLGYREHPFLADALWVALNDTKGHVKDNGETIRVVKCKKDKLLFKAGSFLKIIRHFR